MVETLEVYRTLSGRDRSREKGRAFYREGSTRDKVWRGKRVGHSTKECDHSRRDKGNVKLEKGIYTWLGFARALLLCG